MKNVLLLTDFSELSGYARSLADQVAMSSEIHLKVLKSLMVLRNSLKQEIYQNQQLIEPSNLFLKELTELR